MTFFLTDSDRQVNFILLKETGPPAHRPTGFWILDSGFWILDAGCSILDTGILDAGRWELPANGPTGRRANPKKSLTLNARFFDLKRSPRPDSIFPEYRPGIFRIDGEANGRNAAL
ncbi:hypothetical protein D3OALGB2SA_192 [Olavius algarvensis associated proteobacterium Delta 3]|nr:hypothetical protein D3OALGB2SA_192 [Olavius algarvensis associated proteobacterium Delta 3]